MTRYLCAHPSHARGDTLESVNVTAQVRLERQLTPRTTAYLGTTEDVVRRVAALGERDPIDRRRAVNRVLTGDPSPRDGEILLMASGRVDRAPGLYEIDDLRASVPVVDDLYRSTDASELVVLAGTDDADAAPSTGASTSRLLERTPVRRATSTPEGVYRLADLSTQLAEAGTDVEELSDAIRTTPTVPAPRDDEVDPWRVVVECPVAEGEPPVTHRLVFSAPRGPEPVEVYGVPLAGREALYEDIASSTWSPLESLRRVETRLRWLIAGVLGATAILLGLAWITGALGFVAREVPWTLAASAVCIAAAATVAAFTLSRPAAHEDNLNDTLEVREATRRQIVFTEWATTAVATLAALAIVLGVVAPILLAGRGSPSVPAPTISFLGTRLPVSATISVLADDVASDETMWAEFRTFSTAEAPATLIGRVSATGDREGRIELTQTVAMDARAAYFSVLIWFGDDPAPSCAPVGSVDAGCTILAVPGSSVPVAPLPEPTLAPEPSVAPNASATPSPVSSATASTAPTVSTTPTVSPTG